VTHGKLSDAKKLSLSMPALTRVTHYHYARFDQREIAPNYITHEYSWCLSSSFVAEKIFDLSASLVASRIHDAWIVPKLESSFAKVESPSRCWTSTWNTFTWQKTIMEGLQQGLKTELQNMAIMCPHALQEPVRSVCQGSKLWIPCITLLQRSCLSSLGLWAAVQEFDKEG
jgi:hypothetical protein